MYIWWLKIGQLAQLLLNLNSFRDLEKVYNGFLWNLYGIIQLYSHYQPTNHHMVKINTQLVRRNHFLVNTNLNQFINLLNHEILYHNMFQSQLLSNTIYQGNNYLVNHQSGVQSKYVKTMYLLYLFHLFSM